VNRIVCVTASVTNGSERDTERDTTGSISPRNRRSVMSLCCEGGQIARIVWPDSAVCERDRWAKYNRRLITDAGGFQDHRHRPLGHPSASKTRPEFARCHCANPPTGACVTASVAVNGLVALNPLGIHQRAGRTSRPRIECSPQHWTRRNRGGCIRAPILQSRADPDLKAFIESFNGRLRDECLNVYSFVSIAHAQERSVYVTRRGNGRPDEAH
jgi:Integrase core domain